MQRRNRYGPFVSNEHDDLAVVSESKVRLFGSQAMQALRQCANDPVLDGEVVCLWQVDRVSFQALREDTLATANLNPGMEKLRSNVMAAEPQASDVVDICAESVHLKARVSAGTRS